MKGEVPRRGAVTAVATTTLCTSPFMGEAGRGPSYAVCLSRAHTTNHPKEGHMETRNFPRLIAPAALGLAKEKRKQSLVALT